MLLLLLCYFVNRLKVAATLRTFLFEEVNDRVIIFLAKISENERMA